MEVNKSGGVNFKKFQFEKFGKYFKKRVKYVGSMFFDCELKKISCSKY